MKLKFYAKPEHVVHYPGARFAGQIHNYVGRQFVVSDDPKAARREGQNRATKEGFEIESESDEGRILTAYAKDGGLWPANAETAAAVGVKFTEVSYDESAFEWTAVAAARPAKSNSKE